MLWDTRVKVKIGIKLRYVLKGSGGHRRSDKVSSVYVVNCKWLYMW